MPQLTNPTIYPTANAGITGTVNKAFSATSPSSANTTTKASFGTDATFRWIRFVPLTSSTTSVADATGPTSSVSASSQAGWQVLVADMDRTDTTKRTRIPPGVWKWTIRSSHDADATGNSKTIVAVVYRRKTDGTTAELFRAAGSEAGFTLAGVATYTIDSASQPAYVFERGESLHVEYWVRSKGTSLTGQIIGFNFGTADGISPNLTVPVGFTGFSVQTLKAVGTPVAKLVQRALRKRVFGVAATGTATMARRLRLGRLQVAVSTGIARVNRRITRRLTATAIGTAIVRRRHLRAYGAQATGTASIIRRHLRPLKAVATGTASISKLLWKNFSTTAIGTAIMGKRLIFRRGFTAIATGTARAFAKIDVRLIPFGDGGAPRAITHFIQLAATAVGTAVTRIRRPRASQVGKATATGSATLSMKITRAGGGGGTGETIVAKEIIVTDTEDVVESEVVTDTIVTEVGDEIVVDIVVEEQSTKEITDQ